jgi:hypothetical protein
MQKPRLAVIFFPFESTVKCAICQEEFDLAPNPCLHTTDTWHPVCNRCGKSIDPELTELVTPRFMDLHGYPHVFMGGKLYPLDLQEDSEKGREEAAFEAFLDAASEREDEDSESH